MTYQREIKHNNKSIKINIHSDADESVFNEIFIEKEYKTLDPIIKSAKSCIIDIGGHTGMFSIYATTLNPKIKILIFEPENNNYTILKQNIKLNNCKNIQTKNLAITSKEGQQDLYLSKDSHNHSLIKQTTEKQPTQTTTLTKILAKPPKCDLLKIDCEGSEFEIIKSTPAEGLKKIQNIYIEYHKYTPNTDPQRIKQKLSSAGFKKIHIKPSHYDKRMGTIFATQ